MNIIIYAMVLYDILEMKHVYSCCSVAQAQAAVAYK